MPGKRALVGLCGLWLLVAALAPAARSTTAFLSSSATVGSNSFSTPSSLSTCPSTAPTGVEMIDGFEIGKVFGATGNSAFFTGANTAGVVADATAARNGTYSMKVAATGTATNAQHLVTVVTSVGTVRFGVRLLTLPTSDVELMRIGPSSGSVLQLTYHSATQKLALQFSGGASVESATTVAAGTWVRIDLKLDMSGSTWSGSWSVNGTAQTGRTVAGAAATKVYSVWFGTTSADTYVANYDDVVVSAAAGDYPFGDGKVLLLKPNRIGTNNAPGNFQNDDGSAVSSTSYTRVDDVPMTTSTDYIKQVSSSATSYVELGFESTSAACVRIVQGDILHDTQAVNQTDNGKASIFDGATERIVYSGGMTSTTPGQWLREAIIPPSASTWSPAALNGLVGRIGYSTDVSPAPRWDAFVIEYEVPL